MKAKPGFNDEVPIGYIPIYKPMKGAIVTQAFILCARCEAAISTTGGPRNGALCLNCVREAMKDAP